jgi:NDP-sugar pyrophosphorylase family protein
VSLEQQLFPEWLAGGKHIQAFVSSAKCVDIGTPERYLQAQTLLAGVELSESLLRSEEQL